MAKQKTVSKKTAAAKPSSRSAEKPSAKAFEKSLDESAKALAKGHLEAAIEAATFVVDNAHVLKPKDYGARFHVDCARCMLAFAYREAGDEAAAKAAMAALVDPAFSRGQEAAAIEDELGRLQRKAKLAETDRPATARTILAYCLRHLIFWRESLAAGLHVNGASVGRGPIGAAIATVRNALHVKLG